MKKGLVEQGLRKIDGDIQTYVECDPRASVIMHLDETMALLRGNIHQEIGTSSSILRVIAGANADKELEKLNKALEPYKKLEGRFSGMYETMKDDLEKAVIEAGRLGKDTVQTKNCAKCGGPVGIHATSCGWCTSGLPIWQKQE